MAEEGTRSLAEEMGYAPEPEETPEVITEEGATENAEQSVSGESTEEAPAQPSESTEGSLASELGQETQPEATTPQGEGEGQTDQEEKFFELLNKKYDADFQSDDDIASLMEQRQTFADLSEKEKQWSEYESERGTYKERIADLETKLNPLEHFSSKESYVAEQLRKQHPDKDPAILQEVATRDLKEMEDMDVLVKQVMLDTPDIDGGEAGAREHLESKYGIDRSDEDFEMTRAMKNAVKIDAAKARKDLDVLKSEIEMPEVMTPEDREKAVAEAKQEKEQELSPYMEKFKKFDKWTYGEGEDAFTFDVPDEFKEGLEDMFKGFFIEGDQPVNEQTLEAVAELRDASLLKEYFPKIKEIIVNEAMAKEKADRDKLLNNQSPENTSTATEDEPTQEANPDGVRRFLNEY